MSAARRRPRKLTAEELNEVGRMMRRAEEARQRGDHDAASEMILQMAAFVVAITDAPAGDA